MSQHVQQRRPTDLDRRRGLSRRIRARMEALELTQLALAKRIGIDQSSVSDWLRPGDPAVPSADILMRLVRVLRCNGHWLLTGEGVP